MKVLQGYKEIDIDLWDLQYRIDDIFHKEITDKYGIIIDHNDTYKFLYDIFLQIDKVEKEKKYNIERMIEINKRLDQPGIISSFIKWIRK
ncbi:MAG: hypothetical protein KKB59_19105 [Spirochaetes bacterium]|nr:hypothetical protein [Spirochaetota bacterium]